MFLSWENYILPSDLEVEAVVSNLPSTICSWQMCTLRFKASSSLSWEDGRHLDSTLQYRQQGVIVKPRDKET